MHPLQEPQGGVALHEGHLFLFVLQVQQLLPGHALIHAVPVHAAHHICDCPVQALSELWALQVKSLWCCQLHLEMP